MITKHGTILYGHKVFSDTFCWKAIDSMTSQNKLNRGYGAECFDLDISQFMISEIKNVFTEARKSIEIPPLIIRNRGEVLKYTPGMKLDTHFDIPYCKDDFYPFVTVINLNEGYGGGLYFDCANLEIEGMGSIVMTPSSFMSTHSVREITGKDRYSLLLDITYPEMLEKCSGKKEDWIFI